VRLLSTDLASSISPLPDRAAALEQGFDNPKAEDSILGKIMASDISQLIPNDNNKLPLLCINTTRVQDGSPAVVSTMRLNVVDSAGQRTDVLSLLCPNDKMALSTAAILGARFPYMSPGGRIGNQYFVDGGYFDNSGAGIVHEMLLELERIRNNAADTLSSSLKKMKFYIIHVSNTEGGEDTYKKIHPFINNLASPLTTLVGSYSSQTNVNDNRLIRYLKDLNGDEHSEYYYRMNLFIPGKKESFPMNWVISSKRLKIMEKRPDSIPGIETLRKNLADRLRPVEAGMKTNNSMPKGPPEAANEEKPETGKSNRQHGQQLLAVIGTSKPKR
jgi:hypothetical protein